MLSLHICNGCHWFTAMVHTEPVTCPTQCDSHHWMILSTCSWTATQWDLHLILSLFPRPLQLLTHPSLPWCWRQNKASLCLISFSSMPVPRRSLLRPALNELFMEFPPVLLDGKREVLCWSWSGPLGLQYFGMLFPWQPTSKHLWVGSFEHTEPRLWMCGWNRTYQLTVWLKLSSCIPVTHTQLQDITSSFTVNLARWTVSPPCSAYCIFLVQETAFQGKQVSHPCDLCGSHRTRVAKLQQSFLAVGTVWLVKRFTSRKTIY